MIKASIIATGSELMRGKMDDTNSTTLARFFEERGICVVHRLNISDEKQAIENELNHLLDSDIIVSTGGLGPTSDDLTREAFASFMNTSLIWNENIWEDIKTRFAAIQSPLSDSNKQQAFVFQNGSYIPNPNGTAPGLYAFHENKLFILLPGPPFENRPMLSAVEKLLYEYKLLRGYINKKIIRIYDKGESFIADLFAKIPNVYFDEIGYYFNSQGYMEIHFRKFSTTAPICQEEIEARAEQYLRLLNEESIFYTEDENIALLLMRKLQSLNYHISFAESCTGGAVSALLVQEAGSSSIYEGSVNAYSYAIKSRVLNVPIELIETHGAVSAEVAEAMVRGIVELTGTEVAASITGIAGPDGGTPTKPVGLVCFAFYINGEVTTEQMQFSNSRTRNINKSVLHVYKRLLQFL